MKKTLLALWIAAMLSRPAWASEKLTVMLDWFPNMDHLPILVAQEAGFFEKEGLEVELQVPSDTADPLKLAVAGQVDAAVGYEPQTLIAASEGLDVVAFGRLMDRPLTCLLFLESGPVKTLQDLSGKRLGYTVPGLMDLLLETFAAMNGVTDYQTVNVGYSIVPALVSGQVAAVMGPFKNIEPVAAAHEGVKTAYFELDKQGIPVYDELIFLAGRAVWEQRAPALRAFRQAIADAVTFIDSDPSRALELYLKAVSDADRSIEEDTLAATLPCLARSQDFDAEAWQNFADFAVEAGIISKPLEAGKVLVK